MRRVLLIGRVLVLGVLVNVAGLLAAFSVTAQEATPVASCVAPELPPGTPTPMEEAPAAEDEGEEHDHAATPGAEEEEAPVGEMTLPVGTPADAETAAAVTAAIQNLIACIDSGEYLKAGALATTNFIQNFLGVPTVYDVPSTFEGVGPFEVRSLDNAQTYDDGSVSIDFVYGGFGNGPGGISSERWFFVEEDGLLKLDNILPISLPEGALPGALVVEVTMVDYAFALSQTTLPANQPIVFRVTNASSSNAGHVAVILTFAEGTTVEALIAGESDVEPTGFFGALYLDPGQSGDLGVTGLGAGTYFLACDVETEAGTPHYDLGMVTEIRVE
jgi:uncharacterized cupredoxin-like copper-binding protein